MSLSLRYDSKPAENASFLGQNEIQLFFFHFLCYMGTLLMTPLRVRLSIAGSKMVPEHIALSPFQGHCHQGYRYRQVNNANLSIKWTMFADLIA